MDEVFWECPSCYTRNNYGDLNQLHDCDPHEWNAWCENEHCKQGVVLWINPHGISVLALIPESR